MDDLSIFAGWPSGSATSPTTSRDRCSKPEASDPRYTLIREGPFSVSGVGGLVREETSGLRSVWCFHLDLVVARLKGLQ